MPWKVLPMNEVRIAFVHQIVSLKTPLAEACRKFVVETDNAPAPPKRTLE